jgi:tripartite-type tricarboxylate transporter receptor subunit TctC
MKSVERLRIAMIAAAAVAALAPGLAGAQSNWPERPVRLVVPWAAGGITDILGRIMAQKLSASLGQQFIVDNKAGAGGNIGAAEVAKAPADGYTLMLTNPGAFATNQYLYSDMKYRPEDFAPIILVAQFPNALMVNKDLPVKSTAELVEYAKAHPTALNGGSSGAGSSGHLSLEMFKSMTGAPVQNIFYKGAAPTKIDLASGRIQMVVDNIPGYLSELQAGTVRMLAVGTKQRLPSYPDVPTLDEAGVKGYESSVWYAMAAPRGTPAAISQKVNAAAQAALQSPDVQEKIKQQQGLVMGGTPEDAARFFAEESRRWKAIIEKTGAKIE